MSRSVVWLLALRFVMSMYEGFLCLDAWNLGFKILHFASWKVAFQMNIEFALWLLEKGLDFFGYDCQSKLVWEVCGLIVGDSNFTYIFGWYIGLGTVPCGSKCEPCKLSFQFVNWILRCKKDWRSKWRFFFLFSFFLYTITWTLSIM